MDAKVGGWGVTPRIGKPVEINGLWYNALCSAAYHQGTVWAWLIGPFVSAHLRVYGDREQARSFLQPFVRYLAGHGVGSVSEIFDGDPPFTPRGCIAQTWSVAELLRAWRATMCAPGARG
jgi:glycogen debranching enzyme